MLRLTFLISFLVALPFAAVAAPVKVNLGPGKIGYGSSTAVISTSYQENVFRGFELALQKILGQERAKQILLVKQINDKSIEGASVSANALVQEGAVALVGFPVSHDALLAADIARKHGMLAIFGSPSHTAIAEKGPFVYSTGASLSTLLGDLVYFLHEKFPGKRGLAIVNPSSVFSVNQETEIKLKADEKSGVRIESVRLQDGLVLSPTDLARVKRGEFDYLYFTLYPDDLIPLMNQLQNANIDLPSVGFVGPDPEILRRFVLVKKTPYFIGSTWIPGAPQMKELDTQVRKRYGKGANYETVIGYNLGMVVGQVVKRVRGPLTRNSLLQAFAENRCFSVIGKAELCFGNAGGHATSPGLRFARFTQAGQDDAKAKE